MKFGTKLNHIVKAGQEIADDHDGCRIHVDIQGTVDANGIITGAHSITLERPGSIAQHHNVSIDTMIVMAQEFQKSLG